VFHARFACLLRVRNPVHGRIGYTVKGGYVHSVERLDAAAMCQRGSAQLAMHPMQQLHAWLHDFRHLPTQTTAAVHIITTMLLA
jgi:hypothetical protein